jgi:hypothetical protein
MVWTEVHFQGFIAISELISTGQELQLIELNSLRHLGLINEYIDVLKLCLTNEITT